MVDGGMPPGVEGADRPPQPKQPEHSEEPVYRWNEQVTEQCRDPEHQTDKATRAQPEYVPDLGAPDYGRPGTRPEELGRKDLDKVLQENPALRKDIESTASTLDLDPGLLAATLFAESGSDTWTNKSGKVASEMLGLDDWFDKADAHYIREALRTHPGTGLRYDDVKKTGAQWDVGTEKDGAGMKPRGELDRSKAIAAVGASLKGKELMLDRVLANAANQTGEPAQAVESLPADKRFTMMRVAFNAGVGLARNLILAGKDIPRTGKTTRDRRHAERTAVLHAARAIHLDQAVFGRPPSAYQSR